MRKFLYVPIFCTVLLSPLISSAAYDSNHESNKVQGLLREGINYYESGDFTQALQYLSKVLVVDPSNSKANRYMEELIALKDPDVIRYRQRVQRFRELLDYIGFLENRVLNLEARNAQVKDALVNQQEYDKVIMKSIEVIEMETTPEGASVSPVKEETDIEKLSLDQLTDLLNRKKRFLVSETLLLQKRHDKLRDLKEKAVPEVSVESKYVDTVAERTRLREELGARDRKLDRQQQEMADLKSEMGGIKTQVTAMQKQLVDSDKRVAKVTEDLTHKSLELIEKERALADQAEVFARVNATLNEAQQRLSLVQRIIQEKDEKIQDLEEKLTSAQGAAQKAAQEKSGDVEALRGEFRQLEATLNQKLELSQGKISALEKLSAEQEQRLAQYRLEVQRRDEKIEIYKASLVARETQIADLNKNLQSADNKLVQYDGVIQIYREKLTDANRLLQEKIERINELENTMSRLDRTLGVDENSGQSHTQLKRLLADGKLWRD